MKVNRQKGNLNVNLNNNSSSDKVNISLDINVLDLLVRYSISSSLLIKKGNYINMKSLIDVISFDFYNNKPGSLARLKFIKKALEGRLKYNLEESASIIQYASDHSGVTTSDIDLQYKDLSTGDINYINELIRSNLNTSYLYQYIDEGIQKLSALKVAQPDKLYKCTSDLESYVNKLTNEFRQNRLNVENDKPFSLSENLEEELQDVYREITSSRRRLITGCQGINMIIGDGFENGRVYVIAGIAGSGKSTTMLDWACQIKKHNTNYITRDSTKKPCIVYLTQENSKTETITRLFQMSTGRRMKDCTINELYDLIIESGMYVTPESPIDIKVVYKSDRSIDTGFLYELYDNLFDSGYEMICLMQDHIKRIRSIENEKDVRLELGKVINEFKNFAIAKDIPVITCTHFNREAAAAIETAEANNANIDLLKHLGKHNIGESFLVIDNADLALSFQPQYDKDGNRWAGLGILKKRVETTINRMYQPYYSNNTIKMIEDLYDESIYRTTMVETTGSFINPMNNNSNRPNIGPVSQELMNRGFIKDLTKTKKELSDTEEVERRIVTVELFKTLTPDVRAVTIKQMKSIYPIANEEQKARIDVLLSIDESECAGAKEEPVSNEVQIELNKGIEIIQSKLPLELHIDNSENEDESIMNIKNILSGNSKPTRLVWYQHLKKNERIKPFIRV